VVLIGFVDAVLEILLERDLAIELPASSAPTTAPRPPWAWGRTMRSGGRCAPLRDSGIVPVFRRASGPAISGGRCAASRELILGGKVLSRDTKLDREIPTTGLIAS
jgi:hypothetical protein